MLNKNKQSAPETEHQLLERCHAIAGRSLGELAKRAQLRLPYNLKFDKGLVGQLLEYCLGATAGSAAEPDFQLIAVELKTIPINIEGKPQESTYVCSVPLRDHAGEQWTQCWVKRKLQRVLWLPIEADPQIPLQHRRIGNGILWSPSTEQNQQLQQDWEELMQLVSTGRFDQLSARIGCYLQIRPKAANSRVLTRTHDENGLPSKTLPRGFYLRSRFTEMILQQQYVLP